MPDNWKKICVHNHNPNSQTDFVIKKRQPTNTPERSCCPVSGAMTIMKLVALAALVATAASETVSVFPATGVGGAKPCVAKTFSGHTCPTSCSGMQDISSAAITTAEQCVAACCADPKVCTAALRYPRWECVPVHSAGLQAQSHSHRAEPAVGAAWLGLGSGAASQPPERSLH